MHIREKKTLRLINIRKCEVLKRIEETEKEGEKMKRKIEGEE